MIQFQQAAIERFSTAAANVVSKAAGVTADVFPNRLTDDLSSKRPVARYIQNFSSVDNLYFAFGQDCSIVGAIGAAGTVYNIHGFVPPLQQVAVNTLERVSCWSANAWMAIPTEQFRQMSQ